MEEDKIRIATSIPSLKNKIQTNISGKDPVNWYIRFNIPLSEKTVSEKTMNVTDTEGYIMRTDISYLPEKNLIVITPLDTYEQGVYYLLNITKKVKSLSGKKMRSKVHILFKLLGNQVSEFKILKSNVQVPAPKARTKEYERKLQERNNSVAKVYSFDEKILADAGRDKLPTADIKINILPGILGLAVVLAFLILKNMLILIAGMLICLAGAGHIIFQIRKREIRSILIYNKGVRKFNNEKYDEAEKCFIKAQLLDDTNELAEYAKNKVSFYM